MRTTVRRWCVSYLTTCVLPTIPSACLPRSCVMAPTTVRMDLMRNFAVNKKNNICQFDIQSKNRICSFSFVDAFEFPCLFLADLCSVDNGGCSHNCSIIPGEGFMCSCPLGMELGHDNKTCQIQSFCAKHLKCSQKCEQEKSSVKCSCYEGWELETDMESCKSTGKKHLT